MLRRSLLILLLLTIPAPALAWGGLGHRTVAAIAMQLLPPDKVQRINAVLSRLETDGNIIDAAAYPDEYIRPRTKAFNHWHYAAIPDDDADCRDCLFAALDENLAVIRMDRGDKDEAVALAWVIHLVGDLHQPLHMTGVARGGNGIRVAYRGRRMSLHELWDTELVEEAGENKGPQRLANSLLSGSAPFPVPLASDRPWLTWSEQSANLSRIAISAPRPLDEAYLSTAQAIIEHQLRVAGQRLAWLLDREVP